MLRGFCTWTSEAGTLISAPSRTTIAVAMRDLLVLSLALLIGCSAGAAPPAPVESNGFDPTLLVAIGPRMEERIAAGRMVGGFGLIEKDGKKEFVVLPFEEFVRLEEELADYRDLQELREAKREEGDAPVVDLAEAKAELGLE